MNINFEDALSRLAQDPSDLVAWSVVLDAFEHKVPLSRTINKKSLENNITLFLASPDFSNQGAVTSVLHGNASGNPSWGPITTNDISDYNVSFPKLQPVNTGRILGRTTAGVGVIEQLTGTQLTTLLDLFSTNTTTKGLVPGSNGLSGQYFLKSDGTWSIPSVSLHSGLGNLDYASSGHTGFEPEIPYGSEGQYLGGDKLWHSLAEFGETVSAKHNQLSNLEGGDGVHYYHIGAQTSTNVGYITDSTADAVPTNLVISEHGVHVAVDGTTSAYVSLTWDAINTNTFDHYVIRYKKSAYTYYTYLDSKINNIVIDGLVPNTSYDFGVSSVNKFGITSVYCISVTLATDSDSVAPATVTNVTATPGIQYVIVEWDSNIDADLASYNIYRNIVNDEESATLIGNTFTNYFVDGGRTGGQIYYYWIKAVDTSNNISENYSIECHATPRNVATNDVEQIAANKILIDGSVYLSNWRHAGDITKIDGGSIYTNSITLSQLNFVPVTGSNVIATINASLEGIKISGANIEVNGSTTFASGYNPSGKLDALGGAYNSAGSGARVRIFPDANTGIQVIDDSGSDVFKTVIGGSNIGDVIIGNYAGGQGIFYDKSASTTTFLGVVNAVNSRLSAVPVGSGDLDGSVSTIQAAQTSAPDEWTFDVTGSSGTVDITIDGTTQIISFFNTLEETAAGFAAGASFPGIIVTNPYDPSPTISIKKLDGAIGSITHAHGGLDIVSLTQVSTYAAGAAQIDEVTLSGSSGSCTLSSNGASGIVTASYASLGGSILTLSAEDFVSKYQNTFNSVGINLSSFDNVIRLTQASITGSAFAPTTQSVNIPNSLVGGISIIGNDIFEGSNVFNQGALFINRVGYGGGVSKYRTLTIGDGRNGNMMSFFGDSGKIQVRVEKTSSPGTFFTGYLYRENDGTLKLL